MTKSIVLIPLPSLIIKNRSFVRSFSVSLCVSLSLCLSLIQEHPPIFTHTNTVRATHLSHARDLVCRYRRKKRSKRKEKKKSLRYWSISIVF